jgi:hypothetical protein
MPFTEPHLLMPGTSATSGSDSLCHIWFYLLVKWRSDRLLLSRTMPTHSLVWPMLHTRLPGSARLCAIASAHVPEPPIWERDILRHPCYALFTEQVLFQHTNSPESNPDQQLAATILSRPYQMSPADQNTSVSVSILFETSLPTTWFGLNTYDDGGYTDKGLALRVTSPACERPRDRYGVKRSLISTLFVDSLRVSTGAVYPALSLTTVITLTLCIVCYTVAISALYYLFTCSTGPVSSMFLSSQRFCVEVFPRDCLL